MSGYRTSERFAAYKRQWAAENDHRDNATSRDLEAAAVNLRAAADGWFDHTHSASVCDEWVARAEYHMERAKAMFRIHMGD